LFRVRAYGHDGTELRLAGEFFFAVGGMGTTPGPGDMPGRFVLRLTGDNGTTLVDAMRLEQNTHTPPPGGFDAYFGRDLVVERASDLPGSLPNFIGHRYRGTLPVPLTVQNNDELVSVRAYGYDGERLVEAAQITAVVDGSAGLNDMPTRLEFWVTPDDEGNFVRAMMITSDRSLVVPGLVSTGGAWFVCVDAAGKLLSQPGPCQ